MAITIFYNIIDSDLLKKVHIAGHRLINRVWTADPRPCVTRDFWATGK